ncbi:MAG TPA: APC family permease [Terriglobales bacterium]|jgi:basic amino acid/polyamine antiporter, APA family|nr:APC family permease [Terriglobales bacterium]
MPAPPPIPRHELVRAIGRWSLVALVVNSIIGSGVFGLPSVVAGLIGNLSPYAVLAAGAGMSVIIACFAEVASRFQQAGGPYLYARAAFGRFMGIQTAWMLWLGQVAAPAANANLFVIYLGEFFPHAKDPVPRAIILTLLVGLLTVINIRGVRAGTHVSNLFTAAKLVPLFAVIILGIFVLHAHHWQIASPAVENTGTSQWLKALLLLVFAYGGFETALAPMSEAKNPRRDAPFALFTALVLCTGIYALIQWVVIGVLPNAAHSQRPLADVARLAVGPVGAALIAIGALISFYGYLSAKILAMPRIPFALAEQGDFPEAFAAIHRKFHTPYVSILVFAAMVWALALTGDFKWNVTLSAVARLLYYAVGCAALPILRRKSTTDAPAMFTLPAGNFFAALGLLLCAILITRVDFGQSLILVGTIALALLNWAVVVRKK